jgi:alkylhydroperoxidase family enzyme
LQRLRCDVVAFSPEGRSGLFLVSAWRDAPYFTDAERAALALSEAVTRLSYRYDPVPDEIWNEAARHCDENGMAALTLGIAISGTGLTLPPVKS